jgi:hypothetical protein
MPLIALPHLSVHPSNHREQSRTPKWIFIKSDIGKIYYNESTCQKCVSAHILCKNHTDLLHIYQNKNYFEQRLQLRNETHISCPVHSSHKLYSWDNETNWILCCLQAITEQTHQNCYIMWTLPKLLEVVNTDTNVMENNSTFSTSLALPELWRFSYVYILS